VRRRVLIGWAVTGAVGIALGTAYAAGFASTSGTSTDSAHGEATPLFGQPPAAEFPLYPGAVTTFALPIGFDGLSGQVAHDTDVFTVRVPAADPRTGSAYPPGTTFAVNVFVTNEPALLSGGGGHTPWTTLQLQWSVAPCPGGVFFDETAPDPTFASPLNRQLMPVTAGMVHVALGSLTPGTTYCAGVARAYPDANDPSATDLARPYATESDAHAANPAWTSAIPVTPDLTAQLQRS
jgi:hypothetical protein